MELGLWQRESICFSYKITNGDIEDICIYKAPALLI